MRELRKRQNNKSADAYQTGGRSNKWNGDQLRLRVPVSLSTSESRANTRFGDPKEPASLPVGDESPLNYLVH
jgi:hypothetical protein